MCVLIFTNILSFWVFEFVGDCVLDWGGEPKTYKKVMQIM